MKKDYCLIPVRSNYTLIRKNQASSYHIHPVYHIMFITNGEGYLENGQAVFTLKEKDIFLINANEKHILSTNYPDGLQYITFNFYLRPVDPNMNPDECRQMDRAAQDNRISDIYETRKLDELFDFTMTDVYFQYDRLLWDRIYSSLVSFLDELEKFNIHAINSFRKDYQKDLRQWGNLFCKYFWDFYLLLSSRSDSKDFNRNDTDLMERIIGYLKDNVHEKYSLSKLAAHLNYNPVYICSYFRSNAGLTISQYFGKLKITRSCDYLRSTNKSLTDIAALLNYSSSNHFSHHFKLEKNMCPKDYRKHLEKY